MPRLLLVLQRSRGIASRTGASRGPRPALTRTTEAETNMEHGETSTTTDRAAVVAKNRSAFTGIASYVEDLSLIHKKADAFGI